MTALETLRALLATATPGPWRWWTSNSHDRLSSDTTGKDGDVLHGVVYRDGVTGIEASEKDKTLIVAAVNALPALLDVATQLGHTRAMIVALMKEKQIEPHTMEVIGAKMLGDIDAALAKLSDGMVPNVHGDGK